MSLASILRHYPRMRGVLYDLPEVLATIPQSQFAGCEGRIHLEPGSFSRADLKVAMPMF